jgi:hypothetical protein
MPLLICFAIGAYAQTIEIRQWQGTSAVTRQPEQVIAGTLAEWRGLWSRVGVVPPDMFEPGRTNAVGIFLGLHTAAGYSVNVLSASRRRDRIMVVFEEQAPTDIMTAQSVAPPRAISSGVSLGGPSAPGSAGFAPPSPPSSPPIPSLPLGPPTSPWAIILIHRADLPISVEQRLFR